MYTNQTKPQGHRLKAFPLDRGNVLGFLSVLRDHQNAAQVFLLEEEWADKATLSSAAIHIPPDGFSAGFLSAPVTRCCIFHLLLLHSLWWLLIGHDRRGKS